MMEPYPVFLAESLVWVCEVQLHYVFLGYEARAILKAVHLGSEETLEKEDWFEYIRPSGEHPGPEPLADTC